MIKFVYQIFGVTINKKAEGLTAQLIALIHASAKYKVQLRVILPITSISQTIVIIGEILTKFPKFSRQDKQAGKSNNKYTVNCILVTKIKTQLRTVMQFHKHILLCLYVKVQYYAH